MLHAACVSLRGGGELTRKKCGMLQCGIMHWVGTATPDRVRTSGYSNCLVNDILIVLRWDAMHGTLIVV